MPLERSDALPELTDPNIIVGPRKRRPTERLLENGDPLAHKKARTVLKDSKNMEKHTPSSILPPTHVAHAMPATLARQTPHSAEGAVDRVMDPDDPEAIVVEDTDEEDNCGADSDEGGTQNDEGTTDEDDDAELGMFSITLIYIR